MKPTAENINSLTNPAVQELHLLAERFTRTRIYSELLRVTEEVDPLASLALGFQLGMKFQQANAAENAPEKFMKTHPYVTVAEYNDFLRSKGKKVQPDDNPDLPVVNVSALEADSYVKWKGGRLPTNEELNAKFCPLWEWTSTVEEVNFRIVRGGSWFLNARYVRASVRYRSGPSDRDFNIGFRCVGEEKE
jgi:hypothetical protein